MQNSPNAGGARQTLSLRIPDYATDTNMKVKGWQKSNNLNDMQTEPSIKNVEPSIKNVTTLDWKMD